MKKLIRYPSIEQFRNVIYRVKKDSEYHGNSILPTIGFIGTIKLHGTNSSICYNNEDGIWFQSRERILSLEQDNCGFCLWGNQNLYYLTEMLKRHASLNLVDLSNNTISIYGEWCGKGIQKNVAISEIEKTFFGIGVKVTPHYETEEELEDNPAYWIDYPESSYHSFNRFSVCYLEDIGCYLKYFVNIDFNNIEDALSHLKFATQEVENECPVAKKLGVIGPGEGIVWKSIDGSYTFKTKGERHSVNKSITAIPIDIEKMESIQDFIEYSVTENRVNQAIHNIFSDGDLDIKKMGEVIKWVHSDILKEEYDTLLKNNLSPKEVNKFISNKTKSIFLNILNSHKL